MKKSALFAAAAVAALALAGTAQAQDKIKIGFLPGTVDPFYQNMQRGVEQAAKDLGVDVVTQIPQSWGVEQETPLLNALVARGDLNYIISAPVDTTQMVAPFQAANDAGIKIITVDTFLGDGDYANGPVKFPLSFLGSNNEEGGRVIADGLAKAIGDKGTVYLISTNPNVSSVGAREKGFAEEMKANHPNITVIGPDYDLDDQAKATQMTAAVIEQHPDLAGVFGTNVFSAQGAAAAVTNAGLAGKVAIATWDASAANMENLDKGIVSQVLAQKPFDMGYLAVEFAVADAAGVTSIPKHVETGFAVLDKSNENDPNFSRFIYK
ncbi:MAG TPA: ABC transporter substrate-binding protein [Bauldia sp.]|nr:ABC transporter substrate-binding protein [Bauldia sp.]